jgi:hypothetical protein
MTKDKRSIINLQGTAITILSQKEQDFISLTDMAKKFGGDDLIYSWMRNRNTLEFLGIWEQIHNSNFKGGEFGTFKKEARLNSFHLTPKKWIESTQAIGIQSRAGRYGGGTYAHKDLAFEFGSWLSPEFKLYLIKEFQRLKEDENRRLSLEWNLNRTLSKLNYRIHTDANCLNYDLLDYRINMIYIALIYTGIENQDNQVNPKNHDSDILERMKLKN